MDKNTNIDILALIAMAAGCVAIIASHWFPNDGRKYLWRRDT
ncbi:hypothetical protein E3A20_23390 [Planctomyces bekefii]|uniref:Uncharacterized protein n=1 Tax=Planctomyces bekefii TaxID=1653850 RepID=A0A5C6M1B3_9PLAN|nr:hypothetical protein E3A20_23390 [Planctomyces bekefii]